VNRRDHQDVATSMRCAVKRQSSIFGLWVLTLYSACRTDTQPRKDLTLSPLGIDGVLLCAWLRDIDSVFQVVRDSSSNADGVTWPIKVAELEDSGVVEFQSCDAASLLPTGSPGRGPHPNLLPL
jgi:hypothetical protein